MLSRRRTQRLITLFAWQGAILFASHLLVAHSSGLTELYYSAALTLILKVIALPWILHRLIQRLGAQWDTEPLVNIPTTMLVGLVVVIFAFGLAQPISMLATTITRHTLGIALAVILLSFLMMITRRKAMSQVVGFLSMENGLFFGAMSATYGMPMVIEFGVALDLLVAVLHPRHLLLPDPRAVRQSRSASPRIAQGGLNVEILLVLGLAAAGGTRRWPSSARAAGRAELNVGVSLVTFLAACAPRRCASSGTARCWSAHEQFFIDPFNVFLVTLTAFVGLTTALFSRPYMRIEEHHGRLNARRLRLYHSMYQLFMTTMLIALTTNNMGLLWVAMEAATLSTVLLVSLYRTPRAWKRAGSTSSSAASASPRRCSARSFCTLRPRRLLGREGVTALLWTHLNAVKGQLEPTVLGLAFVFLLVGYGTKVGLARCTTGCPMRMRKARRRSPPSSRACCSMSLSMRSCAARCWSKARSHSQLPGADADGLWAAVGGAGRVLPLAPARHQAALRATPRSSTWASSPSPSGWAGRSRTSPRCCT